MKIKEIVAAYGILNDAKLGKMEDVDKFKVIKALRILKPVAKDFEDFRESAKQKLKDENFDDMEKKGQEWRDNHQGVTLSELTPEDLKELNPIEKYFTEYNKKVDECLKEEAEKEVKIKASAKLKEEAFGKLVASNDWTCGQIMALSDVICE